MQTGFGVLVATIYFTLATDSSADEAISLLAVWGYRDRYNADGWVTGSTLNEGAGLNATDVTRSPCPLNARESRSPASRRNRPQRKR